MGCGDNFSRSLKQHNASLRRGRTIVACSNACVNIARHGYPKSRITTGDCKVCSTTFSRKWNKGDTGRFCSKSCSNRSRRVPPAPKLCKSCNIVEVNRKGRSCFDCQKANKGVSSRRLNYSKITIQELRDKYSTAQFHAKIRGAARSEYKRHNKEMSCENCGYDLHIDICHIRPVADFPGSATLSEVNDISNLAGLDKRCHWEFDNGFLPIEDFRYLALSASPDIW